MYVRSVLYYTADRYAWYSDRMHEVIQVIYPAQSESGDEAYIQHFRLVGLEMRYDLGNYFEITLENINQIST